MTAFVPTHRCGAVPELHGVPSCVARALCGVTVRTFSAATPSVEIAALSTMACNVAGADARERGVGENPC